MPYSGLNDKKLPSYIAKRSDDVRRKWVSIFNSVFKNSGEEAAFIAANSWLKRQMKSIETTAKTHQVRNRIKFVIDSKKFIKKTMNGEEYISAILSDNLPDIEGLSIPEGVLQRWADDINKNLPVGDIDHAEYDRVLSSGMTDDQVKKYLSEKKGIAKAIKAVVQDGKLWIRALIDKRYKNLIEKAKGLSVEAIITRDSNGHVIDGDFLGFTFGINHTPANPRAVIA